MKAFQHHNARSLREAAALLAKYNGKAKVNAGGTDIIGGLRENCIAEYPEILVNIKDVTGLDYIKSGARRLKIGALTKLADIVKSPEIRADYPLLAEAVRSVATPNIRNMATIGGNLAQDIRCWYYRYPEQIGGPVVCLRKGGKTCSALVGDNRYHSIFGAAPAVERRCASHCPAHIDIPGYLRRVRQGNLPEAGRILMKHNPFPAITGRVCPIFCEPQCNRSEFDEPVAIHSIERAVGDYILEHAANFFVPPETESGKNICVIGSGPAGLAAAYYFRKSGHKVTVFERMPEPGGMLLYSIPPFRLPREVVRKQIQALRSMGIRFQLGINAGSEETIARIQSESDAVFVAGGTWRSLNLGVPGEDGRGIHYALEFLSRITYGERIAMGRKVIVIGGGSVAIDAARTVRRLGAEEVDLICLETRDLGSKDRMPALDQEILEAEEEGIRIHPSLGIRKIIVENGNAVGIQTKSCTSVREPDGRFNPQYDESGPGLTFRADDIVVAIGQANDESIPIPAGAEKIFPAGDMASGPSTVVQAVASAKKAVSKIEMLLNGGKPPEQAAEEEPGYQESCFEEILRAKAQGRPAAERINSIDVEDVQAMLPAEVETEAHRCVNCGCLAVGPSDIAIALTALDAAIVTNKRTLSAGKFFRASDTSSTVLEQDELIKEIQVPKPPKGSRQSYLKFTLRKPVDFALVSVASVITSKHGVCSDARITLGAVAPAPLRVVAAEEVIKGKAIDEKEAARAADLALSGALPLAKNGYKVKIARTLVKRAILGLPAD
jgi:NADPH-dependent glutamate synthase beta subunit-like oxidoreductase